MNGSVADPNVQSARKFNGAFALTKDKVGKAFNILVNEKKKNFCTMVV